MSDAPYENTSTEDLPPSDPALASPAAPGELGRLGAYRILKQLGKGGLGVV